MAATHSTIYARPTFSEDDAPLVVVERGSYPASVHRGTVVVAGVEGDPLVSIGNPMRPAFLRSGAKPFQVMPAILTGGIDRFDIAGRELAVLCASHNAEPVHTEAVLSVLDRIGLPESALACGAHAPLHEPTAQALHREGRIPTNVCNNCSGAHAGMLVACAAADWPTTDYGAEDHPLQVMIRSILATFAGVENAAIETAVDNCCVPTFRIPLINAARAFARLAGGEGVDARMAEAAHRVTDAMTTYPEMIGGQNRFDTALMSVGNGGLVAKGGADGFQGVGVVGRSIGLALKISDGAERAVAPTSATVLRYVEALTDEELLRLKPYVEPEQRDCNGRVVGQVRSLLEVDA